MFDYDKLIKKLGKFNDLPNKKKDKLLEKVLCSDDVKKWLYSIGDNEQPATKPMVEKMFTCLANPKAMKRVTKFINKKNFEEFDKSCCAVAFMIVLRAVEISNIAGKEVTNGYKEGSVASKDMKTYREKNEYYKEYIGELLSAIKEKAKEDVKYVCKKANVPKGLVYATYFFVPGKEYIPKFKINMYMNLCLNEIYTWVGKNGIDNVGNIKWHYYFTKVLDPDITASGAISVLLEGVKRIDDYRDAENFEDVCKVWDSLTTYAMSELDRAPENVRRQMLDLYVKRLERIFNNGRGPRLRANMLNIPAEFTNLAKTLNNYSDKIGRITGIKEKPQYKEDNEKFKNDIFKKVDKIKHEDDENMPIFNIPEDEDDDEEEDA